MKSLSLRIFGSDSQLPAGFPDSREETFKKSGHAPGEDQEMSDTMPLHHMPCSNNSLALFVPAPNASEP